MSARRLTVAEVRVIKMLSFGEVGWPMPLFFFDVTDDGALNHSDPLGTEMMKDDIPDEAVAMIVSITTDRLPDGLQRTFSVSVRDEKGSAVFKASLSLVAGWQ